MDGLKGLALWIDEAPGTQSEAMGFDGLKGGGRVLLLILVFGGGLFLSSEWAWAGDRVEAGPKKSGPIPLVNQSPIQLLFLQPVPDRPAPPGAGRGSVRLTTTLTNTLLSKSSTAYDAMLDMEQTRTCLDIRYGIGSRSEVALLVPFYYFHSGILDGFIKDVEEFFGKVREVRGSEEKGQFTYSVTKDGSPLIEGYENKTGFGDAVVAFKAHLFEEEGFRPALGARAQVKMPTGSKGKAFGSGEWDWGVGVLLEKEISPLSFYLNGDVTFPGEAFEDQGVSLQEFYTVMLGVEYGIFPNLSLLSQLSFLSRPFERTGVDPLDRRIYDLLVGADYRMRGGFFVQGGFVQDIMDSADATADISFFLNVGRHF